jgi:hypothetical protein
MKMFRIFILVIGFAVLVISGMYYPLSKFTGQHSFIPGQSVNCAECHPNQAGNLSLSVYHSNLSCRTCHNTTFSPGQEAHAASIPQCIDCKRHANIADEINNTFEAHMPLFRTAEDFGIRRGPNEACLICHTNHSSNITYLYYDWINYTVYNTGTSPDGGTTYIYDITSVLIGPQRTYTVEIKNEGGSTHYWKNLQDISCVRCHARIKLGNTGNSQGAQHADDVLDKSVSSPYHPGHQNASYGGATDAYCKSCHRNTSFDSYASQNPNLNSSAVHAALKLSCLTCHNSTGPYPPGNEPHAFGGHNSTDFYPKVAQNITRRLIGDFCTGCHHANNHIVTNTEAGLSCGGGGGGFKSNRCHDISGATKNDVYTEPKAAEASRWVYRSFP